MYESNVTAVSFISSILVGDVVVVVRFYPSQVMPMYLRRCPSSTHKIVQQSKVDESFYTKNGAYKKRVESNEAIATPANMTYHFNK